MLPAYARLDAALLSIGNGRLERRFIAPRGIHPPAFEPAPAQLGEFWDGVARLKIRLTTHSATIYNPSIGR